MELCWPYELCRQSLVPINCLLCIALKDYHILDGTGIPHTPEKSS